MQFILCTLAAFAFARFEFWGRDVLFALVLIQLMVSPDILILENYITIRSMGLVDTLPAIALPYLASAFGIFLLRQTFKSIPKDFEEAARGRGLLRRWACSGGLYPARKPVYLAYGLVLVSFHWNNYLWPLIITNSVTTRPPPSASPSSPRRTRASTGR